MPKVKMPRSVPALDMTPLVDLAFLLVTFFILTATFRQPEPVLVDVPSSTNDSLLPKQAFLVIVDNKGKTFIDITSPSVKGKVFFDMCKKYDLKLSKEDSIKFVHTPSLGLKMNQVLDYLGMEPAERAGYAQKMSGIPYDTTGSTDKSNELYWWAYYARLAAKNDYENRKEEAAKRKIPFDATANIKFAVKADAKTRYDVVQDVIGIFRLARVKNFEMITSLEEEVPN